MAKPHDRWHISDKLGATRGLVKCGQHSTYPSAKHSVGRQWEARFRDDAGRQCSPTFERQVDAAAALDGSRTDVRRGVHIDPKAGRKLFGVHAAEWLAGQVIDPSSIELMEARMRLYILPTFGELELRAIQPGRIQTWMAGLARRGFAASTIRSARTFLSQALQLAVDDGLIPKNPCRVGKSTKAPATERTRVIPWTPERVAGILQGYK